MKFFEELGWRHRDARLGLEYIAARLTAAATRGRAYVSLRRDGNGPGWLDVDQDGWLTMLRAMLGDPHTDYAETARGRGMLLRLCSGERPRRPLPGSRPGRCGRGGGPGRPVTKEAGDSHV